MRYEPGIAPEAEQPERYQGSRRQESEKGYRPRPVCRTDVVKCRASSEGDCSRGRDDHQASACRQTAGYRSGDAGVETLDGMHTGEYGCGHTARQAAHCTLQPRHEVAEDPARSASQP